MHLKMNRNGTHPIVPGIVINKLFFVTLLNGGKTASRQAVTFAKVS
jgi:hypothetical protein